MFLRKPAPAAHFEPAHQPDIAGLDHTFQNHVIRDNRAGFDDTIREDADHSAGFDGASPPLIDDVIGEVEDGPAFVAGRIRGPTVKLEFEAALETLDEFLWRECGRAGAGGAQFGGRWRGMGIRSSRHGLDRGVAVNDVDFA